MPASTSPSHVPVPRFLPYFFVSRWESLDLGHTLNSEGFHPGILDTCTCQNLVSEVPGGHEVSEDTTIHLKAPSVQELEGRDSPDPDPAGQERTQPRAEVAWGTRHMPITSHQS